MSDGVFSPLGYANFRWLTVGRSCTELANAIAPVALAFAVLDLTGSIIDLGIVVGARSLAAVLLVVFGGMLADRLPRSVIMQGAAFTAAVTQVFIAVSLLTNFSSVPLLVALSLCNGAVAALSLPAAAAVTPQTVPANLLTQANALARMGANTGRFTGAAVGGVLVATLGSGLAIVTNASVFLLAAAFYHGVGAVRVPRTGATSIVGDLVEGWREFTEHTWVWVVVLQFMVINAVVAGGLYVLGPAVADGTIGRAAWGFVLAAQTAGSLVGVIVAVKWRPQRTLLVGVAVVALDVLPLLMLAELPHVIPLLVAMFLVGICNELFVVAWDVSLQENIPPEKLARVYSYDMLGSFIALPVGEVAAGPLGTTFGVETTLIVAAGLIVVTTAAALCSRDVRGLTRKHRSESARTRVAGSNDQA
jgi:MFS family permease